MRIGGKTALGIDICDSRISMALVRHGKAGPELVRTASAELPAGAVKDGNVENAAIFSKAIRDLKTRNRIRASRVAVSLFARPAIVQIMDIPKPVPANIRQFVQGEVKHYVSLPGKNIALDFCGVGAGKRLGDRKVLAVTTDSQKMTELAGGCSRAGLDVGLIEPPLLSYIRAVHAKKIAGRTGCTVLVAMLRGHSLTVCVLRNQAIDFIRTKEAGAESAEANTLPAFIVDEIGQIFQFYDVEVSASPGKWEATVLVDSMQSPEGLGELLKSRFPNMAVEVRTADDAYQDTPLGLLKDGVADRPSPVAIGLAMRMLGLDAADIKINLLPPEVVKLRTTGRDALVAANVAAVIFLLMVLAVDVPALMVERVHKDIISKKETLLQQDTQTLVKEQQMLDGQIGALSAQLDQMQKISGLRRDVDWRGVLDDVRKATPAAVRLTTLSMAEGLSMSLEGVALSDEAVNLFVKMLEKSRHIDSASLIETGKPESEKGFVSYRISCSIAQKKEKIINVN